MPNLNATGPEGKGPMTGGKSGNCRSKDEKNTTSEKNERVGRGRGRRGAGKGRRFRNRGNSENSED